MRTPADFSTSWREALDRGLPPDGLLLAVDLAAQRMTLLEKGAPAETWPISTSRHGPGSQQDSGRTPTGFHRVAERIGEGEAPGRVFADRLPQTHCHDLEGPPGDADLILGRILWLEGLEAGHNRGPDIDSHARYIYIHGTNHLADLGHPASAGCIRLDPRDVVALFDRIRERETWCLVRPLFTAR